MNTYFDTNVYFQLAFLTALFLTVCTGVCLLPAVFREKAMASKILVPLGSLLSGAMLVIYSADIRVIKKNMPLPELTKWFGEKPFLLGLLLLLAIVGYFVSAILKIRKIQNSTMTPAVIKQSMDKLPVGLCFYYENGRTLLLNHRMNELCHSIVGRDLQNAALFWQLLQQGKTLETVTCLEAGEHPTFRLQDGSVWTFAREALEGLYQLSANEITQIHNITQEVKSKKQALDEINKRLRKYGESIDELTRSAERMETKARIHRELGKALLVTRRYVLDPKVDAAPFSAWEAIVAMLRSETEATEEDSLVMFLRAAEQAGIEIKITGKLPKDTAVKNLFIIGAVEALVNAVRHGEATVLSMELTNDGTFAAVRFTNNGKKPTGEMIEGGGLSSLRNKVTNLGGQMTIDLEPEFALTMSVPMERSEKCCTV